MTATRPIVFQHLFKSGGTSVIDRMRDRVGSEHLLHVKSVPQFVAMAKAEPERLAAYAVVAGHLPLAVIRRALPEAAMMTILRDPVDRIVSQYFHFRKEGLRIKEAEAGGHDAPVRGTDGHFFRSRFCADNDFEAYLCDESPENTVYTRNHATCALAGLPKARNPHRLPILKRARANLDRFALVMTTEDIDARFDDAFGAIAADCGIALSRPPLPRGQTRRNVSPLRVSAGLRLSDGALAKLIRFNQSDYALYADFRWMH